MDWYLAFWITENRVVARKLRVQALPVRKAPKQPWLKPPEAGAPPA